MKKYRFVLPKWPKKSHFNKYKSVTIFRILIYIKRDIYINIFLKYLSTNVSNFITRTKKNISQLLSKFPIFRIWFLKLRIPLRNPFLNNCAVNLQWIPSKLGKTLYINSLNEFHFAWNIFNLEHQLFNILLLILYHYN